MGASKVTSTAGTGIATAASSAGEAKGKPPSAPVRATRSAAGMIPGKAFDMPNVLVNVPAVSTIGNSSGGSGKAKGRPSRAAALLAESHPSLSSPVNGAVGSPIAASAANPRKRIFPNPENALVGTAKALKAMPIAPARAPPSQARLQPKPSSGYEVSIFDYHAHVH